MKLNLMLSTLGKISADILKYLSYFSQKTGFDISCKLSPVETICNKCQIPVFFFCCCCFLKNKKKISICHLLNLPIAC